MCHNLRTVSETCPTISVYSASRLSSTKKVSTEGRSVLHVRSSIPPLLAKISENFCRERNRSDCDVSVTVGPTARSYRIDPSSTSSLQLDENEGNTRWNHNRSPRTESYYVALFIAEYWRPGLRPACCASELKSVADACCSVTCVAVARLLNCPLLPAVILTLPPDHDRALKKSDLFYLRERKSETRDLHDREPGLRNVPRYSSTIEATLLSSRPRS